MPDNDNDNDNEAAGQRPDANDIERELMQAIDAELVRVRDEIWIAIRQGSSDVQLARLRRQERRVRDMRVMARALR